MPCTNKDHLGTATAQRWLTPWVKAVGFLRGERIGLQSGGASANAGLSSELCTRPPGLIPRHIYSGHHSQPKDARGVKGLEEAGERNDSWLAHSDSLSQHSQENTHRHPRG